MIERKKEIIGQQLAALGCDKYRITLKPRADGLPPINYGNRSAKERKAKGLLELFHTIPDIQAIAPRLVIENMRGYDIYITPVDALHHHIVIDDMTPEALVLLRAAGYRPALIQKSSENNMQAILIARKEDRKDEQSITNRLLRKINAEFGDPEITGVRHPFRLATFWNKKEGKLEQHTVILDMPGGVCEKTDAELCAIRNALVPVVAARGGAAAGGLLPLNEPDPVALDFFAKKRLDVIRFVESRGWPLDEDKIAFRVSQDMATAGFNPDRIAGAIVAGYPHLKERHKRGDKYARQTAANAIVRTIALTR